ncbi:BspA family leucine-rich repeat surface protein, partial [Marivirga lumbricoides]|uniref:BspA family leucine-rich repeat surface protein n=1 Tax=Marivirga lumbricoides TaxID=1046115 RepID=UPI00166438CE
MHWTASPTAGVTYNIYRSAEPDSSNFSLLANVSTTNYLDEDLDNGIFYFYRVASVLGGVESTPTNVDASTPQASLGSYIELDGNDYLRVASNVGEIRATSRNFSLELWFNSEDVTGSNRQYLLTRKASGNGSAAQIYIQDGEITAHNYINIPGTFPELPFATGLQSNTWYHLTITQTVAGSLRTMKAYLNGVLQRTWDLPEGFTLNFAGTDSQYWYIGAREGNTNSLRGKVAEFRLWNKTLSDTEINSNYQVRLKGDEVDLNGLFHFDDIYNITAYNYTSILRNAITFGDPFAHDPHVKATDDSETILEDVASEFNVKANDIFSNPSQSPKVRTEIITSPSNGTVEVLSNYNILYTPDADFVGTDIIKYLIVDSTALGDIYQFSDTAFVNITINPVNDAPSFTAGANQTINEDAGQQTIINWATNISLGPANENAQTPGFILTNNNNALFSVQPAIDATGELTYTSANNANGSATVDVVLKDDGGTSNNGVDSTAHVTFTITVNPVNDAPVITSGNTFSVQENTLAVTTITATDVDAGDTQSFSITGGVDASLFNIDPSTGVLTFSISPDYENPSDDDGNNDYEVTVTVTDGSGATGTKDITVNVTDENESNYFITTWQTTTNNEQITIPTVGSGYNYKIIWGDGSQDSNVTGNIDHTYTTAGIYTVMIIGDFPRIYFNNVGDKDKILTVEQWGNITWSSMQSAFQGCGNLSIPAIDAPDLSNVESMKSMFYDAKSFNSAIGHWDVSHITDMSYMFWSASAFNQDISDWNVSLVTDMSYMFHMASSFNQPIGKWDVSSVITMHNIFYRAQSLDQNLGAWVLNENLNINYNAWAGSGMSCNSYSATLQGWATNNTSPNTLINKTLRIPLKYGSQAIEARAKLTTPVAEGGFGWIITDDRLNTGTNDCSTTKPFVTTWKTDNPGTSNDDQVIIPTDGGGYDYYLHWVDVTDAAVNATVGPFTGNATLTFPAVGNYRVTIVG